MPTRAEVALTALAAAASGDVEQVERLVTDEFVWHIPGHSIISGDAHGAGAWAAKLQRLISAGLQPEIVDLLEGGRHVALLQRNRAGTGQDALDVLVVNLFDVTDDGVLTRLDSFFSDQPAVDRFWNKALDDSADGAP